MNQKNLFLQEFSINKNIRENNYKQKARLIWFTGLSASGKSTISNELEKLLFDKGFKTFCLDGDNTRLGLNKDLGFSINDRTENLRRIAEVSKLFLDSGLIVLASFISPLKSQRDFVKKTVGDENYIEIYISTPLEVCEIRDSKGLYEKARKREINSFTGISSQYEVPFNPDLKVDNSIYSVEESVKMIYNQIKNKINV